MLKRFFTVVCALALVGASAVALAPTASAAGPVYTVMNTSETLPDGVYYRSDANWDNAVRISGFGVFMGDQVSEDCWASGTPVGPYKPFSFTVSSRPNSASALPRRR